jgi:hypothetical protein
MFQTPKRRNAVSALIAGVAILGALAWFWIDGELAKKKTWEGTVTEVHRVRRWWRGPQKPLEASSYRYYTHYWKVETAAGQTIDAEVPSTLWREAAVGDAVRKRFGQRWPELATAKAEKQREEKDRALDALLRGGTRQ